MYDPEHTRSLPHFAAPSLNLHRFCAIVMWAEQRRPTMVCVADMSRQSRCLLLLNKVGCSSGEVANENNQREPAYVRTCVCVCVCVRARACVCRARACACECVLACTFYLHVPHIVESGPPSPPQSVIKDRQSEMHHEERRVKKRHMK
jgi:hypothetical protein